MATTIKGILGHKLGMTQVFDEANRVVPVTVVAAGPVVVTAVRTPETDGYCGVQFAFGAVDPRKVTKPVAGHFAKAGVTPRRHIAELRTDDVSGYTVGQELTASEVFDAGAIVDVTGTSKGKGYRGRHEAARLQRPRRRPRRAAQAPLAGLHRRLLDPRPGVQGPADGRPDGQPEGDHAEPDRPRRRRRQGPGADPGRGARPQGRRRADQVRRQEPQQGVVPPDDHRPDHQPRRCGRGQRRAPR